MNLVLTFGLNIWGGVEPWRLFWVIISNQHTFLLQTAEDAVKIAQQIGKTSFFLLSLSRKINNKNRAFSSHLFIEPFALH